MPTESYPIAQFDHVTGEGALVFSTDHGYFTVELNDALERAILEAKQIRAERHDDKPVHQQSTLPISQIQALIRAGADPDQVARKYALNSALVRRFAAPVESEKNYAIEQFLRVRAPKESRVRTLAELIERTLVAARIPRESVQWKATRRGLEPWRIIASFQSAGHPIHAEWSWNMHDNTVVCINNAARKLIGEADTTPAVGIGDQNAALNEALPNAANLPGDSARSARIEMTVSAWNEQSQPTQGEQRSASTEAAQQASDIKESAPAAPQEPVRQPDAEEATSTDDHAPSFDTPDVIDVHVEAVQTEQAQPTKAAHRGRRSPIPSWDEIMFGKAPKD
ncbi:DNA-binding protein [Bifidobacterium pseudolongum subsp. globosum]|uniref:septation protein SepH n=1 Tax=Bifidobacterium TaxID=1678 RepID=UPI0010D10442|nr:MULTISPECIES: septation protein SepH [Bifidobacterium]MEE1201603.1 septation protein SepH [Bifidobacterium sp.]RYP95784.1 DNA-binding protein [Bifidobacterium pseudolongum subsp. globosum]RYP96665.1 DNA-binding protein [Bifidobacterium pseudolongum subsp. globosum]RYQ00194.1 DNA-binding protein [Bifidobacterium pseudolongum subsp. globosum]RYQ00480.1 DNA-binding protein [Bifidobacterium pseudolongum subsp. globosum]